MKVILIGGDLAAGKTVLSNQLAERFDLTVINKDILKELLGLRIQTSNRQENLVLSAVCFDLIRYFIAASRSPIVVESNFKPNEMKHLSELLTERGIDTLSLRLTGEPRVLHERFLERLPSRNPIHNTRDLHDFSQFCFALRELEDVVYPGEVIDVDATDFAYQQDESLFERVRAFLEE